MFSDVRFHKETYSKSAEATLCIHNVTPSQVFNMMTSEDSGA